MTWGRALRASGRCLAIGFALLCVRGNAFAWEVSEKSVIEFPRDQAYAVAVDAADDIVAAGGMRGAFHVVKLDGGSAAEIWRFDIAAGSSQPFVTTYPGVREVEIDPAGDVVAAGIVRGATSRNDIAIVKLDGATGAELWRHVVNGPVDGDDEVFALDLDAAGNAVAAGRIRNAFDDDFFVVKLDAGSGAEIWRREIDGSGANRDDAAKRVLVDANGDVVAAGSIYNAGSGDDVLVVELDGATGAEIWRREIDGPGGAPDEVRALAVLDGDVVAGGSLDSGGGPDDRAYVVRLSGVDGAEVWRREFGAGDPTYQYVEDLVVDAGGDVVAVGYFGGVDFSGIVKLDRDDGSEIWRVPLSYGGRVVAHPTSGVLVTFGDLFRIGADGSLLWTRPFSTIPYTDIQAIAAAFDSQGNLALALQKFDVHQNTCCFGAFAAGKGSGDGADLATGAKLLLADRDGDPSRRKLLVLGRGNVARIQNPETNGATLEVRNVATGETDTYVLPASNWRSVGRASFKYVDRDLAHGPCKSVLVRPPRIFKASCRGSQIAFTLDEPSQGEISVVFGSGSPPLRHCMTFGGQVQRDEPAVGGPGRFQARDAAAPAACP